MFSANRTKYQQNRICRFAPRSPADYSLDRADFQSRPRARARRAGLMSANHEIRKIQRFPHRLSAWLPNGVSSGLAARCQGLPRYSQGLTKPLRTAGRLALPAAGFPTHRYSMQLRRKARELVDFKHPTRHGDEVSARPAIARRYVDGGLEGRTVAQRLVGRRLGRRPRPREGYDGAGRVSHPRVRAERNTLVGSKKETCSSRQWPDIGGATRECLPRRCGFWGSTMARGARAH